MTMKMKDVTVGMLFIDTRDGRKVFVTGKNPKYKTLEIQYEGEEPKNTAITTFNKHFQLVTKEAERAAQEQELETVEAPQEVEEVQQEPEKRGRKKREFSEEFAAELQAFIATLDGVTTGAWKNTANLYWVKFPQTTKSGKQKMPRLVEIRIGADKYCVYTADGYCEEAGEPEKVTKYYLHNNFGWRGLEDDFYKTIIKGFIQ